MVIWITGLSGSGKTTLANALLHEARRSSKTLIHLDGDMIREVFGNDLSYSMSDRLKNAKRISNLCKLLDDQGQNVVCSVLSIFSETHEWNRKNIKNYFQVFIDTPIDVLQHRDSKGLYKKFINGEATNVVGMDIEYEKPLHSNYEITNGSAIEDLLWHAKILVKKLA